ncbi:hypothetical protein FSP39_019607 [Pinctada imbricata]|uniref:PiggyBac transposable element-derived protein domain-containing protein n=1 Tax=Pinctada imbricata TaxID=66713 RepID=A0AA89C628_PINIB|nr:hypothetical protein FSP39_019607 [Pinctada imbricata]
MYSSDDSGSDFEGFAPEVVAAAEKKLLDLLELYPNDLSDVDLSDLDFESSDSEDENDDASTSNTNQNGDQWTDRLRRFTIEDFNGTPGPTTILPSDANEIDFFNLLFPSELLEKIAEETNRYAESEQEKKGQDPKWRATTAQEIRAYIGIQIVMGIIVAPNQDMYFSNDSLFKPSGINERITRDRLDKLNQYFHVSDNSQNPRRGQPGHDKLAHVRTIMDVILPKLKSAYNPHKEVSIDEAMIAFTGRLGFKQYVPLKPTKRGIKVWMRADPHNGFVNEFQVYTGKEGRTAEKGLGERVVRDLSRSIWGNYHHIYYDNYFTSIQLFNDLAENKTYACGTIRTNRKGLPPTIAKSKLKKQGDVI